MGNLGKAFKRLSLISCGIPIGFCICSVIIRLDGKTSDHDIVFPLSILIIAVLLEVFLFTMTALGYFKDE